MRHKEQVQSPGLTRRLLFRLGLGGLALTLLPHSMRRRRRRRREPGPSGWFGHC